MCCSDETISSNRVGARVDLSSPTGRGQIVGSLLFLNPHCPGSSRATHVQFIRDTPTLSRHQNDTEIVSIHKSGDLTKPLLPQPVPKDSLLHQFTLELTTTTTKLETSLSLEIGGEGIIGRRVTIHQGRQNQNQDHDLVLLADGIVGFNSAPVPVPPPPPSPFTTSISPTTMLVTV